MRALGVTAALAFVPVACFAVLGVGGWLAPLPALVAAVATLVSLLAFGILWVRDAEVLVEALRRVATDDQGVQSREKAGLAVMETIGGEVERLMRRVAARTALVEQLRRADEAILERLPDPLIVLGPDRAVRRANSAARGAFGADISAVLRHPGLRSAIERSFDVGSSQSAELTVRVPAARDLHATVVPMDPPLADGGRAIVVLSDRTRERAVERMRADFVANASHELRTPLASLIGFIDTLRGPAADDPPAQQRFLGIMAEQAARMNRLIDDLLSLSRVELTEHQPPSEVVDLREKLPRLVAGFEPRLRERSQTLDLRVPEDLPPVTADADQIAQVLQNLLDNAVKYGREGGVLRVTAAPASGLGRWPARAGVVIAVSDEGAGIPREHLPRLTERFYRVDKGRSRAVGGTGLGLAIVKHIVNRHRGQLAIESELDKGTTVIVWLPQAPDPSPTART
ncbi:MAG: two-component sensor histidine kinase [Rhodospirillales bacterium]|nr:two-component sensor histidine kinase [Rhodospirillales bacterium]